MTDPAPQLGAGRVDIRVAPGAVERALAANGRMLAVGVIGGLLALVVAAVVALSGRAHITLLIVIGVLVALIALAFLPKMLGLRRRLAAIAGPDGLVLSITEQGLAFAQLPLIRWTDMLGIIAVDDSARTARLGRLPIAGRSGRAALRAGDGTRMLLVGVRDGTALRAAAEPAGADGLVRLWGPSAAPVRPGDYWILLDSVLDPATVEHALAAVRLGARHTGVPLQELTGQLDFIAALGELMGPRAA